MSKWTLAALGVLITLAIGCGTQAPPVPTARPVVRERTPTHVPANDDEAIRQLINAECEAVVQQDIDRLQGMWASDGETIDAQHTPDNPNNYATWKGWAAMKDRYVNIVFPSNPTFCEHPDTQITISGNTATAVTGVRIGTTNAPNSNKWLFTKTADGWKISSLTYNLNPQK